MFAETSISQFVGGAAFVRAEFCSCWNRTFTLGMSALLLCHDCLLDFYRIVNFVVFWPRTSSSYFSPFCRSQQYPINT